MPENAPAAPGAPAPEPTPQGTPQYGEWYTKIPETVRGQIPEEVYKDIHRGWLRESDYTAKRQKDADDRRAWEAEQGRLKQWDDWYQKNWPEIEKRIQGQPAGRQPGQPGEPAKGPAAPSTFKITVDDLYDNERLQQRFVEAEQAFSGRAVQGFQNWYQQQELPRLDKYAKDLATAVIGLVKQVWPADKPPIDELLNEAAARGEYDFAKVIEQMGARSAPVRKAGYDEGYERGKAEALRAANAPPAPVGMTPPAYKPVQGKPRSREDRFQKVMEQVVAKHGAVPL